mmetsp:Transcript_35349/g.80435  ORF Transcript_35349/g.80435 Transcript_35349/m.80435 type:complete len:205 (-) Transcript_35349:547-1161(-)
MRATLAARIGSSPRIDGRDEPVANGAEVSCQTMFCSHGSGVEEGSAAGRVSPVCSSHMAEKNVDRSEAAVPPTRQSQSFFPAMTVGIMFDPPMIASRPSAANSLTCDLTRYPASAHRASKNATRNVPSGQDSTSLRSSVRYSATTVRFFCAGRRGASIPHWVAALCWPLNGRASNSTRTRTPRRAAAGRSLRMISEWSGDSTCA